MKIDPILYKRLETLIVSMGYELFGCEWLPQSGQGLFRIYIDRPEGVSIDDCVEVSYQVSAMLDVEDPIQGRYRLEISSPGVDRPLLKLEHFKRYLGERVKIKLYLPIDKRRQYKGIVRQIVDEDIYLLVEGTEIEIKLPFSTIEKANLIGESRYPKTEDKRQRTDH